MAPHLSLEAGSGKMESAGLGRHRLKPSLCHVSTVVFRPTSHLGEACLHHLMGSLSNLTSDSCTLYYSHGAEETLAALTLTML